MRMLPHMLCQFVYFAKVLSVEDAYVIGQRVMGRAARRLGKLLVGSPEDLCFRGFCVCVSGGRSGGVADDGGPQLPPPQPRVPQYMWPFIDSVLNWMKFW